MPGTEIDGTRAWFELGVSTLPWASDGETTWREVTAPEYKGVRILLQVFSGVRRMAVGE